MYQPFSAQFFSSIPMAQKFNQCNFSTRNSRSWDITAKHTLERIQTNATSATILQSHNPTRAHPQWRETTQVHRMQKVIQPSSKSEHSYVHSHWRESPNLCTVQKVIHTNWKIEEAHIHRQWRKATQFNYRVQKVIQHSWNLGHTFAYAHWREAPPLYQVSKIIGRNGILKNHILTHSGERSHIYAHSVKSQSRKVVIWDLICLW